MNVTILPKAERQLRKLPKIDQIAIARKIRNIGISDKISDDTSLSGYKDIYRSRVGDYRIVYKRLGDTIYIILIGHRSDIYKVVRRLVN